MRKHSNSTLLSVLGLSISLGAPFSAQALELKLPELKGSKKLTEKQVFNSFGCTGENVSPELRWSKAPKGTQAFAVTVYDPDAPTGSGWWHWVVFNIPADATHLPAGAGSEGGPGLPEGAVQSRTDYGKPGYGGPCPPKGDKPHRYVFTVYALKDKIPLDADAPAAMVGFYLNQNKLASDRVTAKYGR